MKQWYAVYCRPRQEARAEWHLREQGFEVFAPKMTALRQRASGMQSVTEPLFPRYLFVCIDVFSEDCSAIRSTRGAIGLVRSGIEPLPVPEAVIDELTRRADPETGAENRMSETDFQPGESLQITEGPFRGCEAIFAERTGEGRVMVLLNIMQQAQQLTLDNRAVARA